MTVSLRQMLPAGLRDTYDEATAAEDRFDRTGQVEALESAVAARVAVIAALAREGLAQQLFAVVHGQVRVLVELYRRTGDERALEEAMRGARQVLERIEEGHPLRSPVLTELGNAMRARYERGGADRDFAGARRAYRQAYDADPTRPEPATNLATSHLDGYHRTGDIEELERAIRLMHEALAATVVGDRVGEGIRAGNLGGAYHTAWQLTGDRGHLDRAAMYAEIAYEALPAGSRGRAEAANTLALLLAERGLVADEVWRALALHREAVAAAPGRPRYLTNLANVLARMGSFDEAVATLREGLDRMGPDAPGRAAVLANLGIALRERGGAGDLDAAVSALGAAGSAAGRADPEQAVRAARALGTIARSEGAWDAAAGAFEKALEAATELFRGAGPVTHRELRLGIHGELAAEAAYARVALGGAAAAAVDLEMGRALMLSEALGFDLAGLDELAAAGHGRLRDRFAASIAWLREQEAREGDQVRAARLRVAETLARIRSLPGFARFLAPPDLPAIAAAAGDAPLAYVAAAAQGGVAVVVLPAGARAIALPELSAPRLAELVSRFVGAYTARQAGAGSWRTWSQELEAITGWLGRAVVEPLRPLLGGADHAVLVPCGLVGVLPLHAAWVDGPAGRRHLLDDLVVTCAPNARALAAARRGAGGRAERAVVVAEPDATGARPLPGAASEAALVASHFPNATRIGGAEATAENVLAALTGADVLHAACHGRAEPYRPRESGLRLSGSDRLSVADLSRHRSPWRLVVLSACETGIPGLTLPDEVIGLPAGLLQAGAAGVVASLWSVQDTATAALMAVFYELWRGRGLAPPDALREAQRRLPRLTNGEVEALLPDLPDARYAGPAAWRDEWAAACRFTQPEHWAAFCYFGA